MKKEYSKDGLTVTWKPDLCVHAAHCVHQLPAVFRPRERPWINMDGAGKAAIIEAVRACPSGALSFSEEPATPPTPMETIEEKWQQVVVISNGPLRIREACLVHMPNGEIIEKPAGVSICRCGGSSKKPFCDGSHKTNGFAG
jgi:uncharacterized Fe-S cluster protein YjdI